MQRWRAIRHVALRYQLITPVHSEEWKKSILVNRGWVPATWRSDPHIRQPWDTDAEVALEAVVRGELL